MFHERKTFSGMVARERLTSLLNAERLACSPRNMQMLKNDLTMTIKVPIQNTEESHAETI